MRLNYHVVYLTASEEWGQQQQERIIFAGAVRAVAAARLTKPNRVSGAHQTTDTRMIWHPSYPKRTSAYS